MLHNSNLILYTAAAADQVEPVGDPLLVPPDNAAPLVVLAAPLHLSTGSASTVTRI